MSLPRRPTRSQSRRVVSSVSLLLLALVAILCLCPVAVNADEDKRAEYGTVIGIGESLSSPLVCIAWEIWPFAMAGSWAQEGGVYPRKTCGHNRRVTYGVCASVTGAQ